MPASFWIHTVYGWTCAICKEEFYPPAGEAMKAHREKHEQEGKAIESLRSGACTCAKIPHSPNCPLGSANTPEPPSTPTTETPTWELVIHDMQKRDQLGRQKYGTPLQPSNGRDSLTDLYQELLDAVVYVKNEIMKRASEGQAVNTDKLDELCAVFFETFRSTNGNNSFRERQGIIQVIKLLGLEIIP